MKSKISWPFSHPLPLIRLLFLLGGGALVFMTTAWGVTCGHFTKSEEQNLCQQMAKSFTDSPKDCPEEMSGGRNYCQIVHRARKAQCSYFEFVDSESYQECRSLARFIQGENCHPSPSLTLCSTFEQVMQHPLDKDCLALPSPLQSACVGLRQAFGLYVDEENDQKVSQMMDMSEDSDEDSCRERNEGLGIETTGFIQSELGNWYARIYHFFRQKGEMENSLQQTALNHFKSDSSGDNGQELLRSIGSRIRTDYILGDLNQTYLTEKKLMMKIAELQAPAKNFTMALNKRSGKNLLDWQTVHYQSEELQTKRKKIFESYQQSYVELERRQQEMEAQILSAQARIRQSESKEPSSFSLKWEEIKKKMQERKEQKALLAQKKKEAKKGPKDDKDDKDRI